jgi:hypothetical protein
MTRQGTNRRATNRRANNPGFGAKVAVSALLVASAAAAPVAIFGADTAGAAPVTPSARPVVVLDNASNGTTVTVAKGEQVVVDLTGGLRWSEASVEQGATSVLLKRSGEVSSNGSSVTTFVAAGSGSATLAATGRPNCRPGAACPQFVALWQANVVVPATDPRASAA